MNTVFISQSGEKSLFFKPFFRTNVSEWFYNESFMMAASAVTRRCLLLSSREENYTLTDLMHVSTSRTCQTEERLVFEEQCALIVQETK